MYNVSNEYKTQIKNPVRDLSYIKIDLAVQPDGVDDNTTISSTDEDYYSNASLINDGAPISTRYMSLEHNFHVLDGARPLAPETTAGPFEYQGFVSEQVSSSVDGAFADQPQLDISFGSQYYDFPTISIAFDTFFGQYPDEVRLIAKNDATTVYDQTYSIDSAIYEWPDAIPTCNTMTMIGVSTDIPSRRFRVERLVFGVLKIFQTEDVNDYVWTRKVDPINSKLPIDTFDFTIIDKDREYDPENPDSIYNFLEKNQVVNAELGYQLEDGSIEWIIAGTHYTGAEIDIQTDYLIPKVTFKSRSVIQLLDAYYTEGTYQPSTRTLYDLANDVLDFAGLDASKRDISTDLQNYSTMMPLPNKRCSECLQLIANAGLSTLQVTNDGSVKIGTLETTPVDFTYELSDIKNVPSVKKYPDLQGVDTSVNVLTQETSKTLAQISISGASSTVYEFSHEMATNVNLAVGGSLSINGSVEYFAEMARVALTGTGTVTITGNPLLLSKTAVTYEVNAVGERCPIENSLLTDETHTNAYAVWVADYITRKNEYTFDDRGFPEIESGDPVLFDTLFATDNEGTVISSKIRYGGALSGETTLLILNN